MGAKYSCLAPGSTCSGGDVPQTDVAGTCPEGGVCCAPAPSPPPPPFVPDTPTPTTPAATAPPYPTNTPAPFPTTQPTPVPTPPAYECPFGLLPTVVPPTSIANCAVKSCNPCGSSAPDVYQTAKTAIYKTTAWTPSTPPDSNELQCYLDTTDPFLCSQASQSQNGACTTNDIAVDGNVSLFEFFLDDIPRIPAENAIGDERFRLGSRARVFFIETEHHHLNSFFSLSILTFFFSFFHFFQKLQKK